MANAETTERSLIEASKVQGTAVYNPHGERLGSIDDVVIDKRSGLSVYAVMSFGGFLGLGSDYYPIPWSKLSYDRNLGGYVVDIEPRVLEGAPAYAAGATPRWGDRAYEEDLHSYYGAPPYWGDAWR
jgi:sporulation protein YlmC with PRC-barrel domain